MNRNRQGPRTDDEILKDMNPVAKQVLINSGYTPEQIAKRIRNAETPGHEDYGNYFDMTDNNIRGAHVAFTQAGIKYRDKGKSYGDKYLKATGALGEKGGLIDKQIIEYSNLFPVNKNNTNPLASESAHKKMFELIQQYYSKSDPSNPTNGGPKHSTYSVRKKPITVGIVVPGRIWRQLGTDREKLKQQIDLAWDYLESVGIEAGLNPKVVYSNDSRLGGKVHLMPLNKKDQPMFSHWDKGVNWESGLSIAGESAFVGGGGAFAKKALAKKALAKEALAKEMFAKGLTSSTGKTGVLAKNVPKTLEGILIAAGAYGGSTAGNKMFNSDVFGMARDFQLPHALNIGYQELLKDEPSIKFKPKGDSYDILNDPIRVIQNRGAIAKYYNEKVLPGRSIGFETSAWGYGSKPILSEGTWNTIFDLMEQSNKLYRKTGGTDPQTIAKQQKVEKEKELEQQKNKEVKTIKPNQNQQEKKQQDQQETKKQELKSRRMQLANKLLSSGDY